MNDINICIGLPISWDYLHLPFFESWVQMNKPPHSIIVGNRGRQDDQRNSIIKEALEYKEFTHILFLDTDHRHHPQTIKKLLFHDKDIVSGLSFRRSVPYDPIMFKQVGNGFENIVKWDQDDLIEVDAVGAACLLIDVEVLKEMKNHFNNTKWFEMNMKFKEGVVSEDIAFCCKAREMGYKIYVDTSCVNKHLGVLEIDEQIYRNYKRDL